MEEGKSRDVWISEQTTPCNSLTHSQGKMTSDNSNKNNDNCKKKKNKNKNVMAKVKVNECTTWAAHFY